MVRFFGINFILHFPETIFRSLFRCGELLMVSIDGYLLIVFFLGTIPFLRSQSALDFDGIDDQIIVPEASGLIANLNMSLCFDKSRTRASTKQLIGVFKAVLHTFQTKIPRTVKDFLSFSPITVNDGGCQIV